MKKAIRAQIVRYKPNPAFRIDYDDGSFTNFTKQCSPDVAKIRLAKIRDQIELGTFELKDHTKHKSKLIPLDLFFRKALVYFNDQRKLGNLKQRTLDHRADTYAMFTSIIGRRQLVSRITTDHIDQFLLHLKATGTKHSTADHKRHYSPETLRSYKRDLHVAWEYAISKGWASSNPFHDYKIKGKGTRGKRILTADEQQAIIKRFDDLRTVWKPVAFHISKNTGARLGEVFRLKASSLFYEDVPGLGTIPGLHLHGKGDKMRDIPIDDFTHQLLLERIDIIRDPDRVNAILAQGGFKDWPARQQRAANGYILFEVIREKTISAEFRKIFRYCGITDASFHNLRKTFTTESIRHGMTMESMKQWLGHESIRTTENDYAVVEFVKMARELYATVGHS